MFLNPRHACGRLSAVIIASLALLFGRANGDCADAPPSPAASAAPRTIDQEISDVNVDSPIPSWMTQTYYTNASYGPTFPRILQIVPRFDTIWIGSALLRLTIPRYQWIEGVGTGMGDSQIAYLLTQRTQSGSLGIGASAYVPTASGPKQGLGTWGLGPAAAAVEINRKSKFAIGFSLLSLFSFAGPSTRTRQSGVTMTPFFVKQLGNGWSLRSADAQWTWDFVRGSSLYPVSLGFGKLLRFGPESLNLIFADAVTVAHPNAPNAPKNTLKFTARLMYLGGDGIPASP